MKKYNLKITGGTFSVYDVLGDVVDGTQTVLNDGRVLSLEENGSIESYGNGLVAGVIQIESDRTMPEDAVEQLQRQYPGIEFELEEIA
jgi:hypothetical protein